MGSAGKSAAFEHAELMSVVTEACNGADLAVLVTLLDVDPPQNLFLNKGAEKLLGCSAAEFQAKSVWEWVTPRDAERPVALSNAHAGSALGTACPLETTIVGAAGQHIAVEVVQSHLKLKGCRLGVAFLFDVTERKATDLALRQSEARFRALIEGAPDGVAILCGPSIAFLNGAAARLFGAESPEAALGMPITDFLHPEDAKLAATRIAELYRTGTRLPEPAEYRTRSRDGQELYVEISAILTEYQGLPAVLAFARDVSERKAIQARMVEADRLAALGVLSAGIAHEINNPLAYLLLSLEYVSRELPTLLRDPHKLDALVVRVKDACHGAERVASIVRDLRTFVRAHEVALGPVDRRAALEAALNIAGSDPLKAPSAARPESPSDARAASLPAPSRGNVLIVDDDISVARTLKALFQNEHDITLASNGGEALAALAATAQSAFDVIMCDLTMPGMSGMDLFEHIQRSHPGMEQRIVFMTGGVSMDRAREFLATSSNLTFEKPFDFDHLREALRRLVAITQRAKR